MMTSDNEQDHYWMAQALRLAEQAAEAGEVPVGALVVYQGQCIGEGFNQPISSCNPVAHAEILALQAAAAYLENYRLPGCTLYATLEPCTMCAGALVHSRIQRLVFAATEPKSGAVTSTAKLLEASTMNHRIEILSGVMAAESRELLSGFFKRRRAEHKAARQRGVVAPDDQ